MIRGLSAAILLIATSIAQAQLQKAVSLNTEGVALERAGNYRDAESRFREGLAVCEPAACDQLGAILSNLGGLYYMTGQYPEAQPLLERAVAVWPSDAALAGGLATTLANLASVYRAEARYSDAAPLYERAFALLDNDPGGRELASLLNSVAQFSLETGDNARAGDSIQRALAALVSRDQMESPEGVACLVTQASVLKAQGKSDEARTVLERSLATRKRLSGSAGLPEAETYNLGRVLAEQGRRKEAEALYREAIATWEKSLGPSHPNVATAVTSLATLLQARRRFDEAGRLFDRALAIDRQSFPPDHPRIAFDLNNAAALASARKRYAESEELLLKAEAILEARLPAGHPELGRVLANLADIYRAEKRFEESERTYRRALQILDAAWGPADPRLLNWLLGYSLVLRAREDYAEAASVDQHAMRIRVANALGQGQGSKL